MSSNMLRCLWNISIQILMLYRLFCRHVVGRSVEPFSRPEWIAKQLPTVQRRKWNRIYYEKRAVRLGPKFDIDRFSVRHMCPIISRCTPRKCQPARNYNAISIRLPSDCQPAVQKSHTHTSSSLVKVNLSVRGKYARWTEWLLFDSYDSTF